MVDLFSVVCSNTIEVASFSYGGTWNTTLKVLPMVQIGDACGTCQPKRWGRELRRGLLCQPSINSMH